MSQAGVGGRAWRNNAGECIGEGDGASRKKTAIKGIKKAKWEVGGGAGMK